MSPQKKGIVFPADTFHPRTADEEFRWEEDMVKSLDGDVVLLDHNELGAGSFVSPAKFDGVAYYRGWMMDDSAYKLMESGLAKRGTTMLTSSEEYAKAYYFHGWYETFQHLTPRSVWFPHTEKNYQDTVKVQCGSGPYFVKDSVKSRKHEWVTACYAPDIHVLPKIIENFLALQGEDALPLVVVREFENFRKDQGEVRVWWVEGKPVLLSPHPDTPRSFSVVDDDFMKTVGLAVAKLGCPFVTTDLLQRTDGRWRVVEVSDGQVSGLPRGFDPTPLYEALLK